MSRTLTIQGKPDNHNSKKGLQLLPKSTLLHLRFPFSYFLMPVFLFAISQASSIHLFNTSLAFFIFHILVFPSSNGYNSFHDKDSGSIGILKNPPETTKSLLYTSNLMDILAVLLSLFISQWFTIMVIIFIVMSRAYSNRKIRLKKYPIIAFLIVAIFQGGYIYLATTLAANTDMSTSVIFSKGNIACMVISSLFVGSIYPLTQIYQHSSDINDGIITLSYKLGYAGSFAFSTLLFSIAFYLLFNQLHQAGNDSSIIIFSLLMIPVVCFMTYWCFKVFQSTRFANYEYSMIMNTITSSSMNLFFIILIIQ